MIIPRDEAEAEKYKALIQKNDEAGDWVGETTDFSPLKAPKKALAILKQVGGHRLPPK